ncbi:rod shape-determining protein MreD [Enterococcus cecorum]|uniref:Rod shape-determining protein MreD n=1 Tax=Enterococcus cecorum TaxID=44008 RepID=A0AAW9K081_9ENTE|nr:rod shape-determining protein MreD [Enterococcus cecorum]MCJ0574509.1 rod shape-determining protein MreD [Enterococcus cecorum]MCJ0576186.1 rod shape-determining protein MreD [Enterococcus cecorum]MCJ0581225.1 rod shape-determining protein MreD [Enterococcus cecorum]MCJ0594536.1 rod shape-determining protein MreD [Enterococcus cecorum]MDZ5503235.1 rod shape-determining protein MreD [Enterococcus cecorum]
MTEREFPLYLAPVLFLLMLVDTHLTAFLSNLSNFHYIWNVHLVLIVFLWAAYSLPKMPTIALSFVLGLLYDCYYLGIIGIYTVCLTVMVWLLYVFHGVIYQNLYTMFFALVIFVTGYEVILLVTQILFKLSTTTSVFFISRYLAPTLLVNIILFAITLIPLKRLFK